MGKGGVAPTKKNWKKIEKRDSWKKCIFRFATPILKACLNLGTGVANLVANLGMGIQGMD